MILVLLWILLEQITRNKAYIIIIIIIIIIIVIIIIDFEKCYITKVALHNVSGMFCSGKTI